jgi:hypothetical protein
MYDGIKNPYDDIEIRQASGWWREATRLWFFWMSRSLLQNHKGDVSADGDAPSRACSSLVCRAAASLARCRGQAFCNMEVTLGDPADSHLLGSIILPIMVLRA